MKKLITLAMVLMLSGLLATVALAADQGDPTRQPDQTQDVKNDQNNEEREAQRELKAYFQKKQEAKTRQQAAAELRRQNIATDSPGNTGL